jgi:GntR family transcriptional regulator / MocR family aminotransferase
MRTAVVVDRLSSLPLNRQIYEFWRNGILSGRFAGGERVPSTRDVASALDLARGTVTQAYEQLLSEGYLQTARGSGTFVCRQLPDALLKTQATGKRSADSSVSVRLSMFGKRLQHDHRSHRRQVGHIDLSEWGPDLNLFPLEVWRRLYVRNLRKLGPDALNYAEHSQGYEPLRQEIAKYAARSRAVSCTPDQVIVVNGSQQGLDLCARLLLEPGDEVIVENPGYQGAWGAFVSSGAVLRPVPVDQEGLICSGLGSTAKLAYVTPSHQFPTGVALSLRRRLELIRWAREHNSILIEDDYDSEYRYSGAPMPAMQGLASGAPIIYCGTFSKVMFPALRIGYLIVPQTLVAAFRRAKWLADRHAPLHSQAALYQFMAEGYLERHIRRMRQTYGLRRAALVESLETHFGPKASVLGEAAGMHAYVRITDGDFLSRAKRNKVQLREAREYFIGDAPDDAFLLGFSMLSERSIREGVRRLSYAGPRKR